MSRSRQMTLRQFHIWAGWILGTMLLIAVACDCKALTIDRGDQITDQLASVTSICVEEVPFFLATCFVTGLGWIVRTERKYRARKDGN
jgi:hypothetical protein